MAHVTTWLLPEPIQPADALTRAAGHPLVAQILARRGIRTPAAARAFLDPDAYTPASPSALPDLPAAAACLRDALRRDETILVWGDFDVDGQTATALFVSALRELGGRVRFYIPHRLHEGHGIKTEALEKHLFGVDLLLTCDTGVAEHAALALTHSHGVLTIVTDHHDLPPELPPAHAIVDPKRLPGNHPLRELPGVGVAYKLIQELYRLMGRPDQETEHHLDLVALGIVADVATQTGDTRYLLQRGMDRLRQTQRVGLQALIQTAQVNPAHLTTDHIGFAIGPRLNALGRLGDANQAVELLITADLSRARILAAQLEGLNEQRRRLTDQIYAAAQEQIVRDPALLDTHALVLSGPRWHPGVIGIVASRLAETFGRPTVLVSEGEDGIGRGSARSVPGVDIHTAITVVEHLLIGHGGHPGAAGLQIAVERIPEFRRALARAVDALWDRSAAPSLIVDAVLPWDKLQLDVVDTLNALAPFGQGNPPITLASQRLELAGERKIGRDNTHRRLTVRDEAGNTRDVVWWRGAEHALPVGQFDLAYTLKASDYRGELGLQIEYVAHRSVAPSITAVVAPFVQVIDHRAAPDPLHLLAGLRAEGDVVIWIEGETPERFSGLRRDELVPAETLALWTPPPGPRELRAALERVSPRTVYLFNVTNPNLAPGGFVPRLAGLVKHTLRRKKGLAQLEALAAASAQRVETVRAGLHLLQAQGHIRIVDETDATLQLAHGAGQVRPEMEEIQARLHALLQETAAYRAYFARTPAERLI